MSERTIFLQALEKACPAERAAYLDEACGADAGLREHIAKLLRAHEQAGNFLDKPALDSEGTGFHEGQARAPSPPGEGPGSRIGPYRLLEQLGEGGMGTVFLAEQQTPVRIRVALKVIKPGMDSKQVIVRFEAERQALARMDHPNIAKVLDAGTTDAGRPYFVMELVQGVPITRYCDDHRLTPRERLELFVAVCHALQHAHHKGIIHRDVKPSNVLVAVYDGRPVPKVIDFGVAKAVGQQLTEQSLFTQYGQIVGTLEYMSPEQAELNAPDVDTRSDIYALGALLYELLTGSRPFESGQRPGASLADMLRRIHDEVPQKPSTRLRSSADTLAAVAARRKTEPHKLSRLVEGDMDRVVMKALEKDRARRYETAHSFALDVERYLRGEPVKARPLGRVARAWRWCRRNPRAAVLLATVAGLLLVIAVGASLLSLGLHSALGRARDAEGDARAKLFEALLAEARSKSLSRRPGQRFESLALLEQARDLAQELNLPAQKFQELRNATLAALIMPDLYPVQTWPGFPAGSKFVDFDDNLEIYARTDAHGNCSIRRVTGDVELHFLPDPGQPGLGAWPVLSRDARFVAVRQFDRRLRLWKLDGAKPQVLLTEKEVWWVDFRPDGQQVAFSHTGGGITLYGLTTGRRTRLEPDALTREVIIALHPTKPLVAVSSYFAHQVVQVRDLRTGAVVKSLDIRWNGSHVAWHPQGHTLAVSDGEKIHVFDAATFRRLRTFGSTGYGASLFFNHAGDQLVAYGWRGTVQLYEVATGRQLLQVPLACPTFSLRFDRADRRLAGFVKGGRLGICQVGDGREYRTLWRPSLPEDGKYLSAAVSPDGRLLAVVTTAGVGFWDLEGGQELDFLRLNNARVVHFDAPHGALLIGDESGTYRWPVRPDPAVPGLWHIGPPRPLALPAGQSLSQSDDGRVLVTHFRDVGDGEPWAGGWVLHADRPESPRHLLAGADVWYSDVSPDGRWLVTRETGAWTVKLWDARTGRPIRTLAAGGGSAQFSPDGRWLAVSGKDGGLFAVGTWEKKRPFGSWGVFSPDSRQLVVRTDTAALRLVEFATGRELARLEDPDLDLATHVLFTPDGTRLITIIQRKGIHIWDLRLLRAGLARRDLDWDAPPYQQGTRPARPLRIHLERGDYDRLSGLQSVKNFDRAVQAAPHLAVRWYLRGIFHQDAGRYEAARADLRKAVDLEPKRARFCTDLARLYATGPAKVRDPREAVVLAERAVKLQPGEWSYHNTLGLAYYRAGRFRDAVAALEKSLRGGAGQSDALDLYFLALCHHRLGDAARARDCYARARAWHKRKASGLPNDLAAELQRFRAEADAVLAQPPGPVGTG
jgi:serine/threonine protein kinase/WD40 repeat protein/Tfp pilus assembly protein PilF